MSTRKQREEASKAALGLRDAARRLVSAENRAGAHIDDILTPGGQDVANAEADLQVAALAWARACGMRTP